VRRRRSSEPLDLAIQLKPGERDPLDLAAQLERCLEALRAMARSHASILAIRVGRSQADSVYGTKVQHNGADTVPLFCVDCTLGPFNRFYVRIS